MPEWSYDGQALRYLCPPRWMAGSGVDEIDQFQGDSIRANDTRPYGRARKLLFMSWGTFGGIELPQKISESKTKVHE